MNPLGHLKSQGIFSQASSPSLFSDAKKHRFYCGFDPTAPSLHVGNLFVLITMQKLQKLGHSPIAVVGGATGMIGDPSGKSKERVLLDSEILETNIKGIQTQISQFIDLEAGGLVLNNLDWMGRFSLVNFLRDVGKCFRVTEMLNKESVKNRIQSAEGLSFTEFSYQMLQAYDFLFLSQNHDCSLQIGGTDQWGNICSGISLVRKQTGKEVFGLTLPLIESANGQKFGKSEGGNIWLDPQKTPPYEFYQFWLQTPDENVISYLHYFTDLEPQEIRELEAAIKQNPEAREATKCLALDVTCRVHGSAHAKKAVQASQVLFGGSISGLSDHELATIFRDVPSFSYPAEKLDPGDFGLLDLLMDLNLIKSKGQGRKLIDQGGVYLNNERVTNSSLALSRENLAAETTLVLRTGKKKYALAQFDSQSSREASS
jgi:tyrosyl-tRNA synthetase